MKEQQKLAYLVLRWQVKVNIWIPIINVSFVNLWKIRFLYFTLKWVKHNSHTLCCSIITKLGHKCLEPAATLKYEPLNSCITVLSIWIMKIFKCYASKHLWPLQKMTKLWRNKMPVSKCPCLTFSAAMSCLESHWLKKTSTHSTFNLIGPCNTHPNRQSQKETYP